MTVEQIQNEVRALEIERTNLEHEKVLLESRESTAKTEAFLKFTDTLDTVLFDTHMSRAEKKEKYLQMYEAYKPFLNEETAQEFYNDFVKSEQKKPKANIEINLEALAK